LIPDLKNDGVLLVGGLRSGNRVSTVAAVLLPVRNISRERLEGGDEIEFVAARSGGIVHETLVSIRLIPGSIPSSNGLDPAGLL
jgi:hypothetical protein